MNPKSITHQYRHIATKSDLVTLRSAGFLTLKDSDPFNAEITANHLLLSWCTKGSMHVSIDGRIFNHSEGELFVFVPPGRFSCIKVNPEYESCWLTLDGKQIEKFCADRGFWTGVFRYPHPPMQQIEELCNMLKLARTPAEINAATTYCTLCLESISNDLGWYSINKKLFYAKKLIHQNFHNNTLNASWVANQLNVNRKTAYSFFKKNLNCSIKEYIQRIRKNYICRHIRHMGTEPFKLALATGCSDIGYFLRSFKSLFGCSYQEALEVFENLNFQCPHSVSPQLDGSDICSQACLHGAAANLKKSPS